VICALAAWLLLRTVYEKLPPLPWTGVPALLVAAVVEAWTGRDLQNRIAGRRGLKPAAPLFVSRMVALAKATALAGAAIAGLAAGFVIYLSGSLNASVPRQDAVTAAITLAAAVVLSCAALYLEYCCRVPDTPDRDRADQDARLP
jgi:peptidoglycan/LPS O-acetylase OafA/YrhL